MENNTTMIIHLTEIYFAYFFWDKWFWYRGVSRKTQILVFG